jgi:hypothetical protein
MTFAPIAPAVKPTVRPPALSWPAWTDEGTWEISPDGADIAPYTAEDADFWADHDPDEPRIPAPFVAPRIDDDDVRLIDPDGETFDALLDMVERAGFLGDPLPEVTGLDRDQAAQLAAVWADGRRQREQDEAEIDAAAFEAEMAALYERGVVLA